MVPQRLLGNEDQGLQSRTYDQDPGTDPAPASSAVLYPATAVKTGRYT